MADPLGVVRYGRDQMTQYEHQMDSASADIEPGMLIERVNDAGEVKVQPHSTAAATGAQRFVAVEARGRGMQATDNPDDGDALTAYSTGGDNYVRYVKAGEGSGLNVRLAGGENVTATTRLVSAGDGTLRAYDSANDDGDAVVFETEESLDNSGSTESTLVEATTALQG